MSAFEITVGSRVYFEGRKHTVREVILAGPSAPYARLNCDDHSSDYCPAKHGKITWHVLDWVEPQARDDHSAWPSISVLCKGREQGG